MENGKVIESRNMDNNAGTITNFLDIYKDNDMVTE